MKKLFITILILTSINTLSQVNVGFTFSPPKLGWGVVVDKPIVAKFAMIGSYDQGKYADVKLTKYGIGFRYSKFVTLYQYNKTSKTPDNKIHSNSVEIGFSDKFTDRIRFMMLYDVVNLESRFGFAIIL